MGTEVRRIAVVQKPEQVAAVERGSLMKQGQKTEAGARREGPELWSTQQSIQEAGGFLQADHS